MLSNLHADFPGHDPTVESLGGLEWNRGRNRFSPNCQRTARDCPTLTVYDMETPFYLEVLRWLSRISGDLKLAATNRLPQAATFRADGSRRRLDILVRPCPTIGNLGRDSPGRNAGPIKKRLASLARTCQNWHTMSTDETGEAKPLFWIGSCRQACECYLLLSAT